jgi:hypothetical protein
VLEVLGLLLSNVQGKAPDRGVVYHGHECKMTTVRLTAGLKTAEALVEDLLRIRLAEMTRARAIMQLAWLALLDRGAQGRIG